jgi:hypothetical protein
VSEKKNLTLERKENLARGYHEQNITGHSRRKRAQKEQGALEREEKDWWQQQNKEHKILPARYVVFAKKKINIRENSPLRYALRNQLLQTPRCASPTHSTLQNTRLNRLLFFFLDLQSFSTTLLQHHTPLCRTHGTSLILFFVFRTTKDRLVFVLLA